MIEFAKEHLNQFFKIDWDEYKQTLTVINRQREEASYNLISVSTYTAHLENYHSDVWGFLLDPNAVHQMGNQFLQLFIDYLLSKKLIEESDVEDLYKATVFREKGRIDILIVNDVKKSCIIIENKINNAADQDKQLERYKLLAENSGWSVKTILYITPNG